MRLHSPYKCDQCWAVMQPSAKWYIGIVSHETFIDLPTKVRKINSVNITRWDDEIAERDGTVHLCGSECVRDFVADKVKP